MGEDEFKKLDVETLTEHVTAASLAMIEAVQTRESGGSAMNWVALKMLTGDRSKYLGIIFGVTFATLLMAQQMSIFTGIMGRTGSQIVDVGEADIWVMDSRVRFIDEIPALPEDTLQRVRGVDGVAWAVKLYKGNVRCRLEGGNFRNAILFGLDDATLVGAPPKMLAGSYDDLRIPDAVIVDKAGYEYMWPEEKATIKTEGYKLGKLFEMNDRRAVLVGVCQVSMPFMSHADPLHPLQPGDALRAARAEPDVVRAGQGGRRRQAGRGVPSGSRRRRRPTAPPTTTAGCWP